MRMFATVAAAACLALALGWSLLPVPAPAAPVSTVDGGCSPSRSPYLQSAAAPGGAAISYCNGGDAATASLSLRIPAGTLERQDIVVAGYIDGTHVRMTLQPADASAAPILVQQTVGERWLPVAVEIPAAWKGQPLVATLDDEGRGFSQWAGMALSPKAQKRAAQGRTVPWALLVLAAVLALVARQASPPPERSGPRHALVMATLLVSTLLLGNQFYRGDIAGIWTHPDEEIPIKVMESMHAHGDLNTDFARADLPVFSEFRYNFSGYILAAYASARVFAPAAFNSPHDLLEHLLALSRWCSAATLALCLLVLLRHANALFAVVGTVLVALVPQLYQDAHYARLEPLSTLLATLAFALMTLSPQQERARIVLLAVLGGLAGALTTIKFTYVIYLLFCVVSALPMLPAEGPLLQRLRPLVRYGVVSALGFVAGFWVASPSIVADLPGFLAGIKALDNQYGGGHPPHGFIEPSLPKQVGLIASYYAATLGVPLVVLHLAGYARATLAPAKYAFGGVMFITLLAFLTQQVFFERNFSPFLPCFIIIAVVGLANIEHGLKQWAGLQPGKGATALRLLLAALLLASGWNAWSVTQRLAPHFSASALITSNQAQANAVRGAAARLGADRIEQITYPAILGLQLPAAQDGCVLYQGISYNDDWSARYYGQLEAAGLKLAARIGSDFDDLPINTLHTYHSSSTLLYYDPFRCSRPETVR
ncbi:hypothetical protein [Stenotrophomonas sp.]|uniref:hypothetical protein n=1 Tax=Stenotrophomonas sp. TaxID=69392 RepID=UPI0028AB77D1|nr:hypothetical protein [Stenotrophomonas sp.]